MPEEESNVLLELFVFSLISAFIILSIFYVIKIGCEYRLGIGAFSSSTSRTGRSINRSRRNSSSSIRNGLPSFLSDLTTFQRKAILNVLFTDRKCGRVQKILQKKQDGEEKRDVPAPKELNSRKEDDEEMQKVFCLENLVVGTSKEDDYGTVTKDQIFEKSKDNDGLCAICLGPYSKFKHCVGISCSIEHK